MNRQRDKREIRIAVRGRDLTAFRNRLRTGQILRGRVLEVLPGNRIIISLYGNRLLAEIYGVTVDRGQTLALLVKDLSRKIELKWLHLHEIDSQRSLNVSNLTITRLLGILHRLQELIIFPLGGKTLDRIKCYWERLQMKAKQGPLFLARASEFDQRKTFPGEIITQSGGYPAVCRIFASEDGERQTEKGLAEPWFEWCLDSEDFGPLSFLFSRIDGKLNCRFYVLDEVISVFGNHVDKLISKLKDLGFESVEISIVGFNQEIPEIIDIMDHSSDENINLMV